MDLKLLQTKVLYWETVIVRHRHVMVLYWSYNTNIRCCSEKHKDLTSWNSFSNWQLSGVTHSLE